MNRKIGYFATVIMMALSFNGMNAMAENEVLTKTVEIKLEADAKIPDVQNAFLYAAFENQGTADIRNMDVEVLYYTKANYLISKQTLKQGLTDAIPSGEVRKYKLYLGNSAADSLEEGSYPFEQIKSIDHYGIQAVNIRTDLVKSVLDKIDPEKES